MQTRLGAPAGAPGAGDGAPRGEVVKALRHGLEILRMMSDDRPVVSVSEMAREIGVHRSNASRLAATLHAMGFLSRAGETGQYRPGPELIRLGRLAGRDIGLVEQAIGPLRRLVEQTGETGHIGVLDGTEAVTIVVVDGWQTVRMHSHVNKRSPASCSSLGKSLLSGLGDERVRDLFAGAGLPAKTACSITAVPVLLRELAQVRVQGYAVDNEELELGLRCVAAPIRDAEGTVAASLGLSGPAARLTPDVLAGLGAAVREAAAEATVALGGMPREELADRPAGLSRAIRRPPRPGVAFGPVIAGPAHRPAVLRAGFHGCPTFTVPALRRAIAVRPGAWPDAGQIQAPARCAAGLTLP